MDVTGSGSGSGSDFDARVRAALRSEVEGADPEGAGAARTAVVAGVRRRHQRRMALAGGLAAAVAAVAIVVSVGVGGSSPGGGSHASEALRPAHSAPPRSSAPPTAHAPAASGSVGFGAGASGATAAVPEAACPVTRSRAGTTTCAGVFDTTSGETDAASALGVNAQSSRKATGEFGTSAPGFSENTGAALMPASQSVRLSAGHRLTVQLPASSPFVRWARPVVTAGRDVLRASSSNPSSPRGSWSATFTGLRAGTATLSSRAVCEPSAASSSAYASVCHSGTARWRLTVEVTK